MVPIQSYLPWVVSPFIANAPMAGFAGGSLASAVTLAGGFGMIGGLQNISDIRSQLQQANTTLRASSNPLIANAEHLPIGVGFLPLFVALDDVLPVVADARPAVVWLFAAQDLDVYATWAAAIREVSPGTKIWIQAGNIEALLHIAKTAAPDAICAQGADAGGHGYVRGAGIVSLVPEVIDTLAQNGLGDIEVLASGGIVDGRGVAAALSLGAKGAVMGTRFLASREIIINPIYQAAVLEARDGARSTVRSKVFDELNGPNIWPESFDGRSLAMRSYRDFIDGVGIDEIRKLHAEAIAGDDKGFALGLEGRASMWAGTGVGLVNRVEGAGDIIKKVREEVKSIFGRMGAL